MEFHAYNKDSKRDGENEPDEFLLNRMPDDLVAVFRNRATEFEDSLKFSDNTLCVYIGHVEQEKPNSPPYVSEKERIESALSCAQCNSIFIHCSSAGRRGKDHRKDKGLIVLELQPDFGELKKDDWKSILKQLDWEVASAIEKGPPPETLRQFFGPHRSTTLLAAVSILCQGYLAAQAEPGGKKENHQLSDAVREALEKMGWFDVVGSSLLSPALRGEDKDGLTALRAKVKSESYWNAVAGIDGLVEKCKQEWQTVGAVDGLEKLIKSDESGSNEGLIPFCFPISNADLVANAYLALHKRLGGK